MRDIGRVAIADDEQLDRLSEVSESDIERARERWKLDAPAEFRLLLEAEPHAIPDGERP
jgi:hypothetical protein